MPTLRIKLADHSEITHELTADRITIGRRPDNTIQIIDRSVSGHHAELISEDGHYRLHDLGSTNLSSVNGSPVTDFHLRDECRIAFGTVQCEYDPHGGSRQAGLSIAQMEKDLAFLRGENSDLLGQIVSLQRQIDILSSARLVTKKADNTPFAAANDTLKNIVAERDDLRHLASGLKLELERLREELAATVRERDAARQVCELLQAEKVTQTRELHELRQQNSGDDCDEPPPRNRDRSEPSPEDTATIGGAHVAVMTQSLIAKSPTSNSTQPTATLSTSTEMAPGAGTTQKITSAPSAPQGTVASVKGLISEVCEILADFREKPATAALKAKGSELAQLTAGLGGHPVARLCLAMEAVIQEGANHAEGPSAGQIQTLSQAAELIRNLLEASQIDCAKTHPHPKVLVVDDDADLLHTLAACLELSQLPTTTCTHGAQAEELIGREDYDLLLLDVGLPDIQGPALCERVRDNDRYRKTPVVFLTVENTLDRRAQTSLSGGNDFLAKPFNTAELALKAETWIWKYRFDLL